MLRRFICRLLARRLREAGARRTVVLEEALVGFVESSAHERLLLGSEATRKRMAVVDGSGKLTEPFFFFTTPSRSSKVPSGKLELSSDTAKVLNVSLSVER